LLIQCHCNSVIYLKQVFTTFAHPGGKFVMNPISIELKEVKNLIFKKNQKQDRQKRKINSYLQDPKTLQEKINSLKYKIFIYYLKLMLYLHILKLYCNKIVFRHIQLHLMVVILSKYFFFCWAVFKPRLRRTIFSSIWTNSRTP